MHVLHYVCFTLLTSILLQGAAVDITKEPLQALGNMRAVKKDLREELDQFVPTTDIAFSWNYHLMLVRQFQQRNPLFLLDECPNNDSDSCALNRKIYPQYRHAFEQSVVNKIMHMQLVDNEPVQYVSFGSGGLFQDLMVIHKVLQKKPYANLAMHVIDIEYIPCVQMHDALGGNREVLPDVTEHPLVAAGAPCHSQIMHRTVICGLCIELMCKQFIQHLKKSFAQAQLSLRIYSDWKDYIDHIAQRNIPCADIIVAADIEDEHDQAPKDFALLCKALSEKKPHASNILLAKSDYSPTVDLVTFHTAPAADRKPFYLGDGTCMYRSFDVIPTVE